MSQFDVEPFPGRPKILFIGWPNSPHTHSWINLIEHASFNARIFCLNSTEPPEDWWIKCYQTVANVPFRDDDRRRTVYPLAESTDLADALADVIRTWKPDVVHTLGFDPASFLYRETVTRHPDVKVGAWIAQARGGSDTALPRYSPSIRPILEDIFQQCDHFIADNAENYEYAQTAGLSKSKISRPGMGVVPGPGGLDLEALRARWTDLPSKRERLIVWPKAYDTPWAKANPVFEGIIKAWDSIKPCRIEMLWMDNPYLQMWFHKLFSEEMRASCVVRDRVSHDVALELFSRARVMLAPSLVDGIPNSMMEAMALGAAPIVSPIETIVPVVKNGQNVIFARNLYPDEIADALVRAMTDDALVDRIATANVQHVKGLADRRAIRLRAVTFYDEVARKARQRRPLTISADFDSEKLQALDALNQVIEKRRSSEAELARVAAKRAAYEREFSDGLATAWRFEVLLAAAESSKSSGRGKAKSSVELPSGKSVDPKSLIRASGLFESDYYLLANNDVVDAGLDPLDHFLNYGGAEGRRAGSNFDTALYLEQNPDVAGANYNPILHFILHGVLEGRGRDCVDYSLLGGEGGLNEGAFSATSRPDKAIDRPVLRAHPDDRPDVILEAERPDSNFDDRNSPSTLTGVANLARDQKLRAVDLDLNASENTVKFPQDARSGAVAFTVGHEPWAYVGAISIREGCVKAIEVVMRTQEPVFLLLVNDRYEQVGSREVVEPGDQQSYWFEIEMEGSAQAVVVQAGDAPRNQLVELVRATAYIE